MKTHGRDWTRRGGILGTFVLFAAGSVGAATFTVTDFFDEVSLELPTYFAASVRFPVRLSFG